MLLKPSVEEAENYIDTAYALALDPSRSGYPTYLDGIKTKKDLADTIRRGLREERDHRVLLYKENDKIAGLISYFFIPNENYLQTVVFNIEGSTQSALEEFDHYCSVHYPGYDRYLGFPKDNKDAVEFFQQNGWDLLEHSYNNVLHFSEYEIAELTEAVVKVTPENFEDFRRLHAPIEGDMYWNSDRLLEDLENWCIWLYYRAGTPSAAIYCTNETHVMEIFGVDFMDGKFEEHAFQILVKKVLNDCKGKGCRHTVFFTEKDGHRLVSDMGFHCVGEYLLFVKKG